MHAELLIDPKRPLAKASGLIYGQFIEHFTRVVYGGLYDPTSPLSDADGFRSDAVEALRRLRVPVIRWPGGCFASAYHWKGGVGPVRSPYFDKAWRVEESNAFGTDEFMLLCEKLGAQPYLCTNAGTGTAEEMSDWVEYCNEKQYGEWAKRRAEYGHREPYRVKYWSIGNENYTGGEIGSKTVEEWGRFVRESAKMMLRVDPTIELFAASVPDLDWNIRLLREAGDLIRWISIHEYWDPAWETGVLSDYEGAMLHSVKVGASIERTEAILTALGFADKIKIAFDEWNLRGWYHPGVCDFSHLIADHDQALALRARNEDNSLYTMADAAFSACFLNACLRHARSVGMANFSPMVNTRGLLSVGAGGIVTRPTYHVFELYRNHMGEQVIDSYLRDNPSFEVAGSAVPVLDAVAALNGAGALTAALINRHPNEALRCRVAPREGGFAPSARLYTLNGESKDSYNDFDRPDCVRVRDFSVTAQDGALNLTLEPHSVNLLYWQTA